ncbi:MAG: hypothetical protein VX470_10360 [Planctomycetota bacterium]|nr:hypothetical protein [Planctomycetota bacterium]
MQKIGLLFIAAWLSVAGYSSVTEAQDALTPRKLAPNVLKVIPPSLNEEDAVSALQPLYDLASTPYQPETRPLSDTLSSRASGVVFRRDIWGVEFAFKPLRMIEAEVPQPSGKMQKKPIWYLLYRIRFDGEVLGSVPSVDVGGREIFSLGVKDVATSNLQEIRLFPSFVLQASIVDPNTGSVVRKEYLDRLMPYVTKQIQESEDPAIKLFNTVELSSKPLYRKGDEKFAVGREVWGVAVWEDVDPRADYVSIQIQGLTNAFEVEQGQESKDFAFKTLQLNFYRPGDSIDESSDRISYGIPLVDDFEEQIEICDAYQLPGPLLVATEVDASNDRSDRLATVSTSQDRKLNTLEASELDGGKLPAEMEKALSNLGFDVSGVTVAAKIPGARWEFQTTRFGRSKLVRIDLKPQLWHKLGDHFEFKDRLEYFWTYR